MADVSLREGASGRKRKISRTPHSSNTKQKLEICNNVSWRKGLLEEGGEEERGVGGKGGGEGGNHSRKDNLSSSSVTCSS